MDPLTAISLLADATQLGEYAARVFRTFNPRDPAMVVWKGLIDDAAEAAVHAHAGDLAADRQAALFNNLHDLVAANDERAWSVLGGPQAVGEVDLGELDPRVAGLVESFARELTDRLAAEASRTGSPLTNSVIVSSLGSISVGVGRVERSLNGVGDTIETIAENVRSLVAAQPVDLSEAPVSVQDAIAAAREIDPEGAARLERVVTGGQGPVAALAPLISLDPPTWWRLAAGPTVVAAGEYASAYGAHSSAVQLFESAADREGTNRARCLARAAVEARDGDDQHAAALAERASRLNPTDLLVGAVVAVLKQDSTAALELLGSSPHETDPDMLLLAGIQRWALANADRISDAIALARRAIEAKPYAAAMHLQLASLLLARAEAGRASRDADLDEAMKCAVQARDLRRSWHGDSAEAVLVACEIAHHLEDRRTIRHLGLEPPEGEAMRIEAADMRVIEAVAVAAAIEGNEALAERLLPHVTSTFHRHILVGMNAARRNEQDLAVSELRAAAADADNDSHLTWALRGLATLGEWPLPGFDGLAERDPSSADIIHGVSELKRGLIDKAVRRLSPLRGRSPYVPILLAEAYEASGRPDTAVEELRAAFERHGDPSFLTLACRILLRADRFDDAERIAVEAMSVVPASRPLRGEVRQLLIELASQRGDHRRVEDLAATGMAEGDNAPALRWHLTQALHLRNAHDEAWDVLQKEPALEPTTEREAELWLNLHARADARRTTVTQMLQVVARFPDSEQIQGAALVLFYTRSRDRMVDDDEGEAIRALAEAFFARWPESKIMWAKPVDPDDDERFAEQITEIARSTSGRRHSMLQVGEMYDAGRAPYGLVARVAGTTISEGLVGGLRPLIIAAPSDLDERHTERDHASNSLDTAVSLDLVAAHVAGTDANRWSTLHQSFRRLIVADPMVADVDSAIAGLSLDRGGSLGWDDLSGRPVLTGPTPELDAQHREDLDGLARRLRSLDTCPCTQLRSFPNFDARAAAWLGPLQIAMDREIALYSDDLALRRLARSFDTPAFGTVALVEALADVGRTSVADRDAWLAQLHDACIADVYVDTDQATAEGRDASAAAGCLGRPWAWSTPGAVRRLLSFVISSGSSDVLALAGYWFGVGACRVLEADDAADRCARLIGSLVSDILTAGSAAAATVLIRRACMERGLADPLPQAVRNVYTDLLRRVDRDGAARLTLQLFSGLESEAQRIVLRTVSFG